MGSLMAGWDSQDPQSVKYRKNWSFTKGEIEAYWKLKKKIEEEHLSAISSPSSDSSQDGSKFQRSSSLPAASTKLRLMNMDTETERSLEELIKKNGWWTRSNWAFLNETPVLERSADSYVPQFHVANLASASKPDTGIST